MSAGAFRVVGREIPHLRFGMTIFGVFRMVCRDRGIQCEVAWIEVRGCVVFRELVWGRVVCQMDCPHWFVRGLGTPCAVVQMAVSARVFLRV